MRAADSLTRQTTRAASKAFGLIVLSSERCSVRDAEFRHSTNDVTGQWKLILELVAMRMMMLVLVEGGDLQCG